MRSVWTVFFSYADLYAFWLFRSSLLLQAFFVWQTKAVLIFLRCYSLERSCKQLQAIALMAKLTFPDVCLHAASLVRFSGCRGPFFFFQLFLPK